MFYDGQAMSFFMIIPLQQPMFLLFSYDAFSSYYVCVLCILAVYYL